MDINFNKQVSHTPVIPVSLRQRGSLFELLILIVIGLLFFWFIIAPKTKQLSAQNTQVESLNQESNKLSQQQKKMDKLIEQLKTSSKEISKLDESLPLHPRTTWAYLLIQSLVESSGMTVSNLSVSNLEAETIAGNLSLLEKPFAQTRVLKKMSANLGITGTFPQFQGFLKKLENSGRIIDVAVLEVSASQDELLDFRLSLDTYYFTPPSQ